MTSPYLAETLPEFPERFQRDPSFEQLQELTSVIYNHDAVNLRRPEALDNMIRASLMFTVCFYGNLLGCLRGYLESALPPHPFAVIEDGTFLQLLLSLSIEELATDNIPDVRRVSCGPHYVAMLEAAQDAEIDTSKIEQLVGAMKAYRREIHSPEAEVDLRSIVETIGFRPQCAEYLVYSFRCAKNYYEALSTVGLRELSLSPAFTNIVEMIPADQKYNGYRGFLRAHIQLDDGNHGPIMKRALEHMPNVSQSIDTMIMFYQKRLAVYDACLSPTPLY